MFSGRDYKATCASDVQAGQTLHSRSVAYHILEFIGEGCYGKVARCQNLVTKQTVAVKILKNNIRNMDKEMNMMRMIGGLDSTRANVIQFFERFKDVGHNCLVFEMLDKSLYDFLELRNWIPLSVCQIRPITQQLLVALEALKGLSVLHMDIKPDNVMLVSQKDQPFRIKLIDFGAAIPSSALKVGRKYQPIGYRAPEVALGLPLSEAVDVWGVGCVLAFLFLGDNLFPVECEYQSMRCMVEVLGQPDDCLLQDGIHSHNFFSEVDTAGGKKWCLMTPDEYCTVNEMVPKERNSYFDLPSSLDGLVHIDHKKKAVECEDRTVFVDLLKGLLRLEGDRRVSPHQALQHPYLAMPHLTKYTDTSPPYVTNAHKLMEICRVEDSGDVVRPLPTCGPSFDSGTDASKQPSGENKLVNGEESVVPESKDPCRLDENNPAQLKRTTGPDDEEEISQSSDEEEDTQSPNEPQPSPVSPCSSTAKVFSVIRGFFRQFPSAFTCCFRPTVED